MGRDTAIRFAGESIVIADLNDEGGATAVRPRLRGCSRFTVARATQGGEGADAAQRRAGAAAAGLLRIAQAAGLG
jgi:hypothetical protein